MPRDDGARTFPEAPGPASTWLRPPAPHVALLCTDEVSSNSASTARLCRCSGVSVAGSGGPTDARRSFDAVEEKYQAGQREGEQR
ncbi:hypothetical protein ACQPXB_32715 [Amycolatopsis sp. CA-161197]|uniref:hypothetical protein n=1 Tax=Amycolatopsis sp. CA-161197 TaxID=3239922 RepID=UPI003D8D2114